MATASSRFCGNKAGVDPLDKSKIQRVIEENTSQNFGNHEHKRAKRIEERVQKYKQMLAEITPQQLKQAQIEVDKVITELEEKRQLTRYRVHIDMDAFFAAVECRDNPSLRTVPMAVGSDAMLSTSNYLARKFGVRSAMPGFIGKKLCPQIIIVPCNFSKYKKESQVIRAIFEQFDPSVSMGSLDEASLDITNFVGCRNSPVDCKRIRYTGECVCRLPLINEEEQSELGNDERITEICEKCQKERIKVIDSIQFGTDVNSVVQQIRFEVEQATGLTCSAGIASNGRLAKICSDLNKPNGQYCLENSREAIVDFMRDLPVRKVPFIGPVSEAILKALDVETCGHLLEKAATLRLLFYQHYSEWLLGVSLGISGGDGDQQGGSNEEESGPKSTSIERTFAPTNNVAELLQTLHTLCDKLIRSLQKDGIFGGRAATLKIKFSTFDVITRCKSVDFPIRTTEIIYPIMEGLLKKEMKGKKAISIRLLGVRLSNLIFSENISEEDKRAVESKGVQKSLLNFCRPSTSNSTGDQPILIELSDSDGEEENENINEGMNEEEEDMLNNNSFDELLNEGNTNNNDDQMMELDDENEENNTMQDEEEEEEEVVAAETSSSEDDNDEEDVIFVEEKITEEAKKNKVIPSPKGNSRKRKSTTNAKQKKGKADNKPKGMMKDLRDYFPTVL